MGYDLITVKNCQKINSIIKETSSSKQIEINIPSMDLTLNVDEIVSTDESEELEGIGYENMVKRCFMYKDSTRVLKIKKRDYALCLNLGSWGYKVRIDDAHLVLSSTYSGFGRYFSQLEFSQSLEDDENVYIVKNISKLAGEGSISRLNKGAKTKDEKYKRRDMLVGRLDKKVIDYDGHKWLCIDSISKKDLWNENSHASIFDSLIFNLLNFTFNIEDIISNVTS